MATFTAKAGTDWIDSLLVGAATDRWRLDDYDVFADVVEAATGEVAFQMTLDNGRLAIADPATRRLEINVGWSLIEPLTSPLNFDLLFINRSTDVRSRSDPHTLVIDFGITNRDI